MNSTRTKAAKLYHQGSFSEAACLYKQLVENSSRKHNKNIVADLKQLSLCLYAAKNMKQALIATQNLQRLIPEDTEVMINLSTLQHMTGNFKDSIATLEYVLKKEPDNSIIMDSLNTAFYKSGLTKEAIKMGINSLITKEKTTLSNTNPNTIEAFQKKRNSVLKPAKEKEVRVISYSLWGTENLYLQGAILNASLAPILYPGWKCRFYCEKSLAEPVLKKLEGYGAEIILMPKGAGFFHGLFWRFLVANDPNVDRYIIRDVDSPITVQERLAIEQWIDTEKDFHIIRDFYSHSELILAGLWGGVKGALPELNNMINDYFASNLNERTIDQIFLREKIWPYVKDNHLAHDEYFKFGNAINFSKSARNPENTHIGQTWPAFLANSKKGHHL